MSNEKKGIFEPQEGFASGPSARSPFSVDETPNNPFASAPETKSPFSVEPSEPTRLSAGAEKEKSSDPFASGAGKSPFGYEPPVAGFGGSPFEGSPAPAATAEKKAEPKAEATPFGDPAPAPVPAAAPAPAPAPAAAAPASPESSFDSDSSTIRQLELRAIFGVDRELSASEIMDRSKALPGIRNLARVAEADAGVIDSVKHVLGGLGFGDGKVQLVCGNAPVNFIREGKVLLAVQADGNFAPGVRETLMIVARELGRM